MGKLIHSTEKSRFYQLTTEAFAKTKVGQYSKYLNSNPTFVTYFETNDVASRADIGTDNISVEIGPNSPLKFNMIRDFPIYKVPELRPDIEYSREDGMDINIEMSDITILPKTITPKGADYVLIQLPDSIEMLFRVNSFRYNTVQSNDFYSIDLDLKYTGHNLIDRIMPQVIEKYHCIFENIGTQDKCLFRDDEFDNLLSIVDQIELLKSRYIKYYYNKNVNSFVLHRSLDVNLKTYYDIYLTKFIIDTELFYEEWSFDSIVLTYEEVEPYNFEMYFDTTLWGALKNKNKDYLNPYIYNFPGAIGKRTSSFNYHDYETWSAQLSFMNRTIPTSTKAYDIGAISDYFDIDFIEAIIANEHTDDTIYNLVIDFMNDKIVKVPDEIIVGLLKEFTIKSYYFIPIIIYILIQNYKYYIKSDLKSPSSQVTMR